MPKQEHYCPKCEQPLTQVGSFWICPQHGQVSLEKPFVPMRVFLSYGHDEHTPLARRLRDDLVAREHQVWFDEEQLPPGHDWETRIEEGLEWLAVDKVHSAVVLLLTPYSVRRPDGYCLNEVARALGRGLRIIPLMVVESEPPLSICRIQWLDMRECIPISEKEALYGPKFERLLRALEDGQLDFEGTQSRLLSVLQPIQFSADILKLLRDFTGREWVFDEVDRWLNDPSGSKIFWITGAPGVGKSALSAWVREHRREIAAFHFCDINSEEKRNPAKLVRSIVYQLSTQLPEYEARLARLPLETIVQEYHEAYTLFDKLLVQPLAENFTQPDRTVVVLIDALDEATYERQNEIVRFLSLCASKTPPWLRFLVTSRPEPEIVASFRALSPYVLDTSKPENLQDLRAFLHAHVPGITGEQTDAILERSEGVFLYVRHVVDALQAGHLHLERLDEFPRGLGDVYQQFFQRQFGGDLAYYEDKVTPLLQVILAAFEPLTLGQLQGMCDITSETELGRRLNRLGALFPTSGETETDTIRPFHRSLCDWITSRESAGHYLIAVADGHRILAECGWEQYVQGQEAMEDYFLQWLPSHLLALADDQRLVRLLRDFRYLMEKTRRGMLEQLLTDFRELPSHATTDGNGLEIVVAFFREKAHILRRSSDEWPAHKILLQLAVEHADDSPLTVGAEQWLAEDRCDWLWLRRVPRLPHAQRNPCLAVLEGHTAEIEGVQVLNDGRLLSWSRDKTLRLWAGQSGACLAVLEGHTRQVDGVQELSGGRLLSWSADRTLRLWAGQSGACLDVLKGHTRWVNGAQELSDGRLLSWSDDGTLRLWDGQSVVCLAVLEGHTGSVNGAQELADGRLLSWSADKTLRLWDGQSGACLAVLEGHTKRIYGAHELSDGRLLSWSLNETLRLWDGQSGTCLDVQEGHTGWINGMQELSDGRLLSWSRDKTLRLWDGQSGACLDVLKGHNKEVNGAQQLSDGRLLSWSADGTLRLWDGQSGACLDVLEGHTDPVYGAQELSDGRLLSWSEDKTLRLWDGQSGACLAVLEGHTSHILAAQALANGRLLSWSRDDKTLRLWDGQSGACLAVLEGHTRYIRGIQALSDRILLSWSDDGTLRLWDGQSGTCLDVQEGHTGWINGMQELSDGRLLSWSRDKTLRLWDGQSGACLDVLKGHNKEVNGAQQLSDGRLLSWSNDRTLRLWDGQSGACLDVLEGHDKGVNQGVNGAQELSDGRLLSWSEDKTLRLWAGQSGACLDVLEGHASGVRGAQELSDGRLLSWAKDDTLRLWDGQSGACLAVLKGHIDSVWGAQKLSDGRLLSWSYDKTLRLWDGQSGACLAVLKGHNKGVWGAQELSDGRLLSWASDDTLRLWDDQSGACLEVVPDEQVARKYPEWVKVIAKADNPPGNFQGFFVRTPSPFRPSRSAGLRHNGLTRTLAIWNADTNTRKLCLLPDGTVVMQDNGQVCFLKLHHGQRRISLTEAESLLPQLYPHRLMQNGER